MPDRLEIRAYQQADEREVIALWRDCGLVVPPNDPASVIELKLAFQPDLLLVAEAGARMVGTAMAGYEGRRGWINYVAVSPTLQREGIGRQLTDEAERRLHDLGCQKVNLQVRNSNLGVVGFYECLGYTIDDVTSMGKRMT